MTKEKSDPDSIFQNIWLFHLVYFIVLMALTVSIYPYEPFLSLLLLAGISFFGMISAFLKSLAASQILAISVGLIAPFVFFARLGPSYTIFFLGLLVLGVTYARRQLFEE